jgi:hypothetical protein
VDEFARTAVWAVEMALDGVAIAGVTALIKDKVAIINKLQATKVDISATARAKFAQRQTLRAESSRNITAIAEEQVAKHLDRGPYNSRTMEIMLKANHPEAEITSTTLPKGNHPNVKFAGTRHPESGIVFDNRGFPILDEHVKYETRISGNLKNMSREAHMRAGTRQLRADIEAGVIDKNMFSEKQLTQIKSGLYKIEGYTWHHHQDLGRMQLVPTDIHKEVKHVEGFEMWGGGK